MKKTIEMIKKTYEKNNNTVPETHNRETKSTTTDNAVLQCNELEPST